MSSDRELPGRLTAPQPMMGPDLSDAAVQTGAGGRVSTTDACKNKGGYVGAAGECLVCDAEAGVVCRR
jgi:hypothetical protein